MSSRTLRKLVGKVEDPEYLRIMPETFKIHKSLKDSHRLVLDHWNEKSKEEKRELLAQDETLYYASWLAQLELKNNPYTQAGVVDVLQDDPLYWKHDREDFKNPTLQLQDVNTEKDYVNMMGISRALKATGLRIHGGLKTLAAVKAHTINKGQAEIDKGKTPKLTHIFPTACLIVTEPEKACQYIDIGECLALDGIDDAGHQISPQALQSMKKVKSIIRYKGLFDLTSPTAKNSIIKRLAPGSAGEIFWQYRREKFRFKVLKTLQAMGISETAVPEESEEIIKQEDSADRSRKRARIDV